MEDLKLLSDKGKEWWTLCVEPLEDEKVYLTIKHFGDEAFYHLNKDQAKQIVEHLTKVFEL